MAQTAQLVQLLEASLNSQQHRQAEDALKSIEKQPGFSIRLLEITASPSYPETVRLSSALCFKNLIRRSWTDEDGNHLLAPDEVVTVKKEIVGLMISSPPRIQAQLGDAISVIADSDFGERWDTLVDDLVSRLSPTDTITNNGVLQVAHSIFKRWRPLYRSDALFTEINEVLQKFATPFLQLLQHTDNTIQQTTEEKTLQQNFATLEVSMELLYDLSIQDLPPMFEEGFGNISALLQKYLQYDNALLHTDDESEAGPLENTKAAIFEVITMWVQKYEDAFGDFVGQFVHNSWTLLTTLGPDTKYDLLTSRALHFLKSIASHKIHGEIFNKDETLAEIVEKVILPNVSLRTSDIEMFEDEPIEFTRRDLEGSDSETRRRAATDFLRQLMQQFQGRVTTTVMRYVDHYLHEYAQQKAANWKSKDTAIYLFNSIAAIGLATATQGVVSVNPHVNVMDFFQKNVAAELVDNSSHIILQVDAIKFLYLFRTQMSREQWQEVFPLLVKHLASPNYVLHTYAAIVIDRALALVDEKHEPYIPQSTLVHEAKALLQRLFLLIENDSAPEKVQENEFLMRCVMRVLVSLRADLATHVDFLLTNFINITRVIRHNPSNPRFYYFLFESVGALIRFAGPANQEKLETTLYPPFAECLSSDVQEFAPYIFQLFAALLEANPSAGLSEYYKALVPSVLMPILWESKGNSAALARLLASLVARDPASIVANAQLEPTLGIFQKLISSKSNDTFGFDLLETLINFFPTTALAPYYPQIFTLLLTRLSNSRTDAFAVRFCRLYHLMAAHLEKGLGADAVKKITDSIQSDLFKQIYPSVILAETPRLQRPIDRKIAVISSTKTLGDSEAFATVFVKGWGRTVESLLGLMVNAPVLTKDDLVLPEADVDDLSFGVGFTPLNTCKRSPRDPFADIGDLKGWMGAYLGGADSRHGGRVQQFLGERLDPQVKDGLMAYMSG